MKTFVNIQKHVLRLWQLLQALVMQPTTERRVCASHRHRLTSEMHPRTSIDDSGL